MLKTNFIKSILVIAISDDDNILAKKCLAIIKNQQNTYYPYLKEKDTLSSIAIKTAFHKRHAILAIGSTAIVIRSISLLLKGKKTDPAVLSLNSDAKAVSILLGAAKGGDFLANLISEDLSCVVAGTGPGYKHRSKIINNSYFTSILGKELGWNWSKNVNIQELYKLIDNKKLNIEFKTNCKDLPFCFESTDQCKSIKDRHTLVSTIYNNEKSKLIIYPPILTLGIGCIRNANPKKMYEWLISELTANRFALQSIVAIATIVDKADEPAILEFARKINKPLRFFHAHELKEIKTASPSKIVEANMGTPSVAEASSLALAGYNSNSNNAFLCLNKTKNNEVTFAVSQSTKPLFIRSLPGFGLGTVYVVGIGPGGKESLTFEAFSVLEKGDAYFGYSEYIKRVKEIIPSKIYYEYNIGEEIKRVNDCVEYATKGHNAILVCSGDASIYGLASLLCSCISTSSNPLVKGLRLKVIAGISAMQLASARFGAILNHDFCAISLSDLLTPIEIIHNRIKACAKADLVVAFYNPKSKKRITLLDYAINSMLEYRPDNCPVIIAKNLGKYNEEIKMTKLKNFNSKNIDMNTIVICGNSQTAHTLRISGDCIWTPRGYPVTNNIN